MKVWLYVWKACRNYNEDNPSNSDYILVDIEGYFGSVEKYNKLSDEDRWKGFAENWADHADDSGSQYGYSYGWLIKEPSKEWINNKIKQEKTDIGFIEENIKTLSGYL